MSLVNIGGDKNDSSYRYKMPRLKATVQGRGNGIKTRIENMIEVAKALHCDPAYVTKFFGIELGAQSSFDAGLERTLVNGVHEVSALSEVLDKFIDMFILCPNCGLPEIKMRVKKDQVKIDCAACGHNTVLKYSHKLMAYIVKHPPTKSKKGKKDDKDKKKKDKKKKKKKDKKKDDGDDNDDEGDDDGADDDAAQAEEEQKQREARRREKEAAKEVVWHTDTSSEAQEARKKAEFKLAQAGAQRQSDIEAVIEESGLARDSPEGALKLFITERERQDHEVAAELRRLELARGLDATARVRVLLAALIDTSEPRKVAPSFAENASIIKKAVVRDAHSASVLIACIEEMLGVNHRHLAKLMPHALKALYDEDVVEEDQILAWYSSPPEASFLVANDIAVELRSNAKKFCEWLKEADEDSSSGSDDDDDEEEEAEAEAQA